MQWFYKIPNLIIFEFVPIDTIQKLFFCVESFLKFKREVLLANLSSRRLDPNSWLQMS